MSSSSDLIARYYVYEYSGWYWYGRWILLGVAVFVFFLCLCSTVVSRRRVNQGRPPIYGTAWALPNYHQSQNQYGFNQPAPPYGPPPNNGHYDNNGNFHGQQPPPNDVHDSYNNYNNMYAPQGMPEQHEGTQNFAPPPGPPPGHSRPETEESQSYQMSDYMPPSHPPSAMTKN
ncbi:hypothetical protein NADFUDRAFT_43538 [Nadsonia fulvescens var. elongata DSM 6958]|uniref:Uncharacterized protein n=1 Tax=Nadsonia fulvescens var. elongata DSM 6958 TaxID=857566 RepID=A0A1E3PEZ3_9ASCO|nr:hypothetical protein NADFUDRAFT_43538 [Nadsonia fulvescens var. elongata DSM 6958]